MEIPLDRDDPGPPGRFVVAFMQLARHPGLAPGAGPRSLHNWLSLSHIAGGVLCECFICANYSASPPANLMPGVYRKPRIINELPLQYYTQDLH